MARSVGTFGHASNIDRKFRLAQPGPIIRDQNRVAGIRRIVFHAHGLSRDDAFEAGLFFQSADVLRRFVRHAGNRIGVEEHAMVWFFYFFAVRALAENPGAGGAFLFGGPFDNFENLSVDDAAHAIEIGAALAFDFR